MMVTLTHLASATTIQYFTRPQANRVVNYLNRQSEMVIYCGYEYELETYVIISEIWMEPVDAHYYEIWLFGFDAYTGEEIYMPLDLGCVWLYNSNRRHIYSAARYLRFECDNPHPNFSWSMPQYNSFARRAHPSNYYCTYHYDVHCYGWRPPVGNTTVVINNYYMRTPTTPLPVVTNVFTPGYDRPVVHPNTQSTPRPQPITTRPTSSNLRNGGTSTGSATARPASSNLNNPAGRPTSSSTSTPTARPASSSTSTQTPTARPASSGTSTQTPTARPASSGTSTQTPTARPASGKTIAPNASGRAETPKAGPAARTQPSAPSTTSTPSRQLNSGDSKKPSSSPAVKKN